MTQIIYPAPSVEDMTTLSELTENAILENLRQRYEGRLIYTYTGSILVALNPYEKLDIYTNNHVKQYTAKRHNENPPHIFAVAEAAYSNVRSLKHNQAVIISGESGAGKSESTKVILQYLTAVTSSQTQESWVEQQILEANTVLESFGNAKTVRNNNSSRFGKFIQILFNKSSNIVGASIVNYLLEKSRIAKQAKSERNYHVFYELVQGASDEERARFDLPSDPEDLHYLSQSGCIEIAGVNDKKHFEGLKLALTVLNMTPADQEGLFKALSAILWIGNIKFKSDEAKESVQIENPDVVAKIAALLGVDVKKLESALLAKKLAIRGEISVVPYKPPQALENRDSIGKAIYDNIFQRLVEFMNLSLTAKEKSANFVGVLDIFGFEEEVKGQWEAGSLMCADGHQLHFHMMLANRSIPNMTLNTQKSSRFEQFCINYTNEKLQQFFNQFIFKLEQEEAKATGILSLLDEETRFPKGTDESWLGKQDTANAKHAYYIKPKMQKGVFGIKHYAGEVLYTVSGFLEKNKDAIQEEIYELVQASKTKYIAKIFPKKEEEEDASKTSRGGKQKATAGAYFKNQLLSLVTVLSSTTPHYVRCIKPNQQKEAFGFDEDMVVSQLRYSGMLDTIRIRKAGYPMRLAYEGFSKRRRRRARSPDAEETHGDNGGGDELTCPPTPALLPRSYKSLIPPGVTVKDSPKTISCGIAKAAQLPENSWQPGKTKLFLKADALEQISAANDKILTVKVLVIQKRVRGYLCRTRFLRACKAVRLLQRYTKGFLARKNLKHAKRAIIKMQSVVRGWFARDYYRGMLKEKREEEERAKARERGEVVPQPDLAPSRDDGRKLVGLVSAMNKQRGAGASAPTLTPDTPDPDKPRDEFDNLFAFLGDFDPSKRTGAIAGADALAEMAAALTADIDSMFDNAPAAPAPPPVPAKGVRKSGSRLNIADTARMSTVKPAKEKERRESVGDALDEMRQRGMKANPIARKEKGSNTSIEKINYNSLEYAMSTYAEKHFETHMKPTSTFSTLTKKTKQAFELDEMLAYSKIPIALSITKIQNKTEKSVPLAVECFKNLLKALEPAGKKQEEAIHSFISVGLENPELHDELFVQVIKQVTPPKGTLPKQWDQIQLNGWQVLALSSAAFPPSKTYRLVDIEKNPIRKLAHVAEESHKAVMLHGARKFPPSALEIAAIKTASSFPCRFGLLDGQEKDISINPTTTAGEVVKELAKLIDLKDPVGWSLYEVNWKLERAIKASDYIADIMSAWEKEKKVGTPTSHTITSRVLRKKTDSPLSPVFNVDANLVLKKRVFRNVQDPITDPVEYNLLYAQAVDSVARDSFPLSERVVMQMAALRAQVLLGDCEEAASAARFGRELPDWIVSRLVPNLGKEQWVEGIVKQYLKLRGTPANESKVLYLETAKGFKGYGSSLFVVRRKGISAQNMENIVLAVSQEGIAFVHPKTKERMTIFPYKEIKNYDNDHEAVTITVVPSSDSNDMEITEVYQFETVQSEEIVSLIREYCPTTEYSKKAKEAIVSDTDLVSLRRDVEKFRNVLLENGLMRRPGPESGLRSGISKATMTIRRLGASLRTRAALPGVQPAGGEKLPRSPSFARKRLSGASSKREGSSDDLKSMAGEGGHNDSTGSMSGHLLGYSGTDVGDYVDADWSFATKPIMASLIALTDPELEQWAVETYATLFSFQGSPEVSIPDPATFNNIALQSIAEKCLESPYLSNELYVQLVKLTTEHPQPDSLESLNLWKLFCVFSGVVMASGWVLEYVKAHLRRASAVDLKAKKPRKEEAQHAKYSLKAMHKTVGSGARKFPPSTDEIAFATKMTPMRIRFHTLDGEFRAIPIEPFDTFQSVFVALLEKMNLPTLQGFSIYEQFMGLERAVAMDEKISDLLYKWEKQAKDDGTSERVHFVLKKRLFVEPHKPCQTDVEESLVLAQALADIKGDLYPINEAEAIQISALSAQAIHGDVVSGSPFSYKEWCTKTMPPRLIRPSTAGRIEERHMELLGTKQPVAKQEIMQFIRSWPLYGSGIFEVYQSYSNEIPSECWLAVSKDSIHIVARQTKEPLVSHKFEKIVSCNPSQNCLLLIIDNMATGAKYVFTTSAAHYIASLIKDYKELIDAAQAAALAARRPSQAPLLMVVKGDAHKSFDSIRLSSADE
ncbi:P-loop containing nucleoside triphosphate hydrolase protein [Blyttiomyces helicus]|uniref:P-loop containing nucleoside triphosphate hydrolase protein n=1 Tax=Blyttiomyces helicus TaxID=388810 RepID=A0A4P9WLZ3_9FUNG|nr:P-loop containing nucleoside triphosphate hydrolase protein [Blyttiomyces helicus]|eukprot:RKO92668.1 P-loop containing nucleoside triphosphate hydrolase protein [Blyttiomyces helicus]